MGECQVFCVSDQASLLSLLASPDQEIGYAAAKGPRLPCRLPMRATQGATGVPPKDRLMAWLPSVDASRCSMPWLHVDNW
ncbi:hypothetical protein CDEST_02249 [Colletotrichum destructivum]|uniref:Uncharacterized protein n=1 Tax=Colletotrichum destructivum TaxID=34406 RepID=A0AAX4I2R4_9PEZI|nr:hypothetical protein CDEST_02249 [Colletotrichum destructivum]